MKGIRIPGPRVLVRKFAEVPLPGRIQVVQFEDQPANYGEVLVLGKNNREGVIDPELRVGQTVLIATHCGTPVDYDGETLYLLVPDDILAICR